jgi:prolyl oligopeptidase
MTEKFVYPTTKRGDTTESHFGTDVADPYRWLEDPDSEETQHWVDAQNDLTQEYIKRFGNWDDLNNRFNEVYNYDKYSTPNKRGGFYTFSKKTGLQNQYVVYVQDSLESDARVLLDPNTLSEDGTASLNAASFSKSGKFYAYGVSRSGSDWITVYVRDVETGEDLGDKLEWVKFTDLCWTHDDAGFFYCRYPKPESVDTTEDGGKAGAETDSNLNHMVCYHRIGTDQSEDILIYQDDERPEYIVDITMSDDGRYLIICPINGCSTKFQVFYTDLNSFGDDNLIDIQRLIDNEEAKWEYITNVGSEFYFKTDLDAPRGRVVRIDLESPDSKNWDEIISELTDVMGSVICVNQTLLVVEYLRDVKGVIEIRGMIDGRLVEELELPGPGSIRALHGRAEDSEFFYTFESFNNPGTFFRYDCETRESSVFRTIEVPGFNSADFIVKQVFYPSKDGTQIPMFIVHSADLELDGRAPICLYGYGGFEISIEPFFNPFDAVMIQNLGIGLAVANIRGGGEYGQEWHDQGKLQNKQNVFDDFQAGAEYLINEGYTNSQKLVIKGGSNGGLLVAACVNQRPDLFGCGIAAVGVMDMLRFHKFTIGHAWRSDYGDPDVEEDFNNLIKYSPVHNVRNDVPYPAMLLMTGDHDDRVVPLHTHKLISTLQYEVGSKEFQTAPLMVRIETKAGHGGGKPTSKIIEERTDTYAFVANALGLEWRE